MKTIAIIHGWAGGPRHTRKFVEALKVAGFKEVRDPFKADIVFAHSGGCYGVPAKVGAHLVVLHGPPYWPEKSIIHRVFGQIVSDSAKRINHQGLWHFLHKKFWEFYYILRFPGVMFRALRNHRKLDFLEELLHKKVLLIRNSDDRFCSPTIKAATAKYQNIAFEELPGLHDDFYVDPEPYIRLIKKHL